MSEVERECLRRIAETKSIPLDSVTPDTTFESLSLDSLDRITLAFDLEEKYGIEIPEHKLQEILTVRDVVDAVQQALLTKQNAGTGVKGIA